MAQRQPGFVRHYSMTATGDDDDAVAVPPGGLAVRMLRPRPATSTTAAAAIGGACCGGRPGLEIAGSWSCQWVGGRHGSRCSRSCHRQPLRPQDRPLDDVSWGRSGTPRTRCLGGRSWSERSCFLPGWPAPSAARPRHPCSARPEPSPGSTIQAWSPCSTWSPTTMGSSSSPNSSRPPSLAELVLAEGPLPPRRVAEIGAEVASVLEVAHGAGIVHRDVKPANVMVRHETVGVRLAGFGVTPLQGVPQLAATALAIGSPSYVAPEQARGMAKRPCGRRVGARRDDVLCGRGSAAVRQGHLGPDAGRGGRRGSPANAAGRPVDSAAHGAADEGPRGPALRLQGPDLAALAGGCGPFSPALREFPSDPGTRQSIPHPSTRSASLPQPATTAAERSSGGAGVRPGQGADRGAFNRDGSGPVANRSRPPAGPTGPRQTLVGDSRCACPPARGGMLTAWLTGAFARRADGDRAARPRPAPAPNVRRPTARPGARGRRPPPARPRHRDRNHHPARPVNRKEPGRHPSAHTSTSPSPPGRLPAGWRVFTNRAGNNRVGVPPGFRARTRQRYHAAVVEEQGGARRVFTVRSQTPSARLPQASRDYRAWARRNFAGFREVRYAEDQTYAGREGAVVFEYQAIGTAGGSMSATSTSRAGPGATTSSSSSRPTSGTPPSLWPASSSRPSSRSARPASLAPDADVSDNYGVTATLATASPPFS